MARTKNEAVTATFHYLVRELGEKDNRVPSPLTLLEFKSLSGRLAARPAPNLAHEEEMDRIRYRLEVPTETIEQVNDRTVFGQFYASYWGHSYNNTARGKIPADSVSLRPFFFLMYLSESGKLYLGSQYLGQFGSYMGLMNTIRNMIPNADHVAAHTFRLDADDFKQAEATEVRVTISRRSSSIAAPNVFRQGGIVTFKKGAKADGFEADVADNLFPFLGSSPDKVKKAVADMLNDSQLLDVEDDDIQDCTVIARMDGRRKVIHMLQPGSFATRFNLDVGLTADGHPKRDEAKKALVHLLTDRIIPRSENA